MSKTLVIGLMTPAWPGVKTANGIATAVYNLALGLSEAGHEPVILTEYIDGEMPDDAGFAPPVVPIRRDWRLTDRVLARLDGERARNRVIERSIAEAAERAVKAHGVEILVLEESFGWAGAVSDRLAIPVVAALHGPWGLLCATSPAPLTALDRQRIAREARAFGKVSGLLAPSASAMAVALDAPGTAALPKAIIPNPMAPAKTTPADGKRAASILFVGRFDTVKGGDTVIEAFGRLGAVRPEATLTFVGPDRGVEQAGGTRLVIADAIAALPSEVRGRVTYTGPLPRADVEALRSTHSIALIGSRYEVFAYTMAEAMAAGQAIVCTDVGGPGQYQTHGKTALMVPPDDAGAMAAALARLLDDGPLRQELARNGLALLEQRFSPRAVADETVTFLRSILDAAA